MFHFVYTEEQHLQLVVEKKFKNYQHLQHVGSFLQSQQSGVSTADVYGDLKVDEIKHPNTKQMIEAIENKDFDQMCASIGNVLERCYIKITSRSCCFKRTNEKIWSRRSINEWKWSNSIWTSSDRSTSTENL